MVTNSAPPYVSINVGGMASGSGGRGRGCTLELILDQPGGPSRLFLSHFLKEEKTNAANLLDLTARNLL